MKEKISFLLQFIQSGKEDNEVFQKRIKSAFSKFTIEIRFFELRVMFVAPRSEAKKIRAVIKKGEGLKGLYLIMFPYKGGVEIIKGPAYDSVRRRSGNIKLGGSNCAEQHRKLPLRRKFAK